MIDEARLATRLDHPNIARTFTLGKAGGVYFIEMEYVSGPTLSRVLEQCDVAGAMPIAIVVHILIRLCDALAYVHQLRDDRGASLGLVHRDVSPQNIIVAGDGTVKLIDFGIAKGLRSSSSTEVGVIKGKVAYVAPEYLGGMIDRRADLFALGVIGHELLCHRRLFLGVNDLDTVTRIRELRVPPPSRHRRDVRPELDAVIMRALERDPAARWQSAGEMRAALDRLGCLVHPTHLRDWVAWAFERQPARTSQVVRVLDSLA